MRQLFLCQKNENRSRSSIEFQNLLTFKYANKLLKLYIRKKSISTVSANRYRSNDTKGFKGKTAGPGTGGTGLHKAVPKLQESLLRKSQVEIEKIFDVD